MYEETHEAKDMKVGVNVNVLEEMYSAKDVEISTDVYEDRRKPSGYVCQIILSSD